jgi:ABC-type sugar transport system ATPase subunit
MVGDVPVHNAPVVRASGRPVLQTRELRGPRLGPLSLTVHSGEIVGFVGLEGSGIDTLLRGLGGAAPLEGAIAVSGRPVRLSYPSDALRAGLVYMPPDRKLEGLWLDRSPVWNIAIAALRRCAPWRWPGSAWLGRLARDRMAQVSVRATVADAPVRHLSGGNQQRVLFARSLEQAPAVLLLSDPTRGVDVRAKSDIHKLIETLAADGIAVCFACSGIDEVLALAQRIVCMHAGRIVADGPRGTFDEARVLAIVSSEAAAPS